MKKVLLTLAVAGLAASVFAQGTVVFNNAVTGVIRAGIYGPEAPNSPISKTGNTTAGTPAGTQVYAGALLNGPGYLAQLFSANGSAAAESSLAAALPVAAFRTGTAAGFVTATTATLENVPANAPVATLQLRAWDNSSGQYPTWAAAEVAWQKGLIAAGKSATFDVAAIGGTQPAPNLLGLRSFNIYFVPEPSTMALAGLGAAAMMIFRRRK